MNEMQHSACIWKFAMWKYALGPYFDLINEQILFLKDIQKNEARLKAIRPDVASLHEIYKNKCPANSDMPYNNGENV